MLDTPISTEQWLRQELDFINTTMSHTLNGQLKAAFVSCNEETQELTLEFPLEGWQVNGLGTLHGGMAYTMMDLAMSIAVYCFSRETIPAHGFHDRQLSPAHPHGSLGADSHPSHLAGPPECHPAYCEAIIPSSGKVACTAIGTYAVIKKA